MSGKAAKELVTAVLSKFELRLSVLRGIRLYLTVCQQGANHNEGGPNLSQSHALSRQLTFVLISFSHIAMAVACV